MVIGATSYDLLPSTSDNGDTRLADPVTGAGILTTNTDPLVVGVDPLTGLDAPPETDMLMGAVLRSQVVRYYVNGDFALPPRDATRAIDSDPSSADYNPLPGWVLVDTSNGHWTAMWVADATSGSGGRILFQNDGLATVGTEIYLQARPAVLASSSQAQTADPAAGWTTAGAGLTAGHADLVFVRAQSVRADSTTTTGPSVEGTYTFTNIHIGAGPLAASYTGTINSPRNTPADAGRLLTQVGVRTVDTGTASGVYLSDVSLLTGSTRLMVTDYVTPANRPAYLEQVNGTLLATVWTGSAHRQTLWIASSLVTVNTDMEVTGNATVDAKLRLAGIAAATINADQNDFNPTGWSGATQLEVNPTGAARTLTGLSITGRSTGNMAVITNANDTNNLVLADTSVSSSAANRFLCPNGASVTIRPHGSVWLRVGTDSSSNVRWFVIAP